MGHEFGHALTSATADLVYYDEAGALNESMSDFWGAMIERKNWLLGEDSYTPKKSGDAIRYMDAPSKGAQPELYKNYVINGDPHLNSGIPNKAAYLIATAIGKGDAEQVYYRALTVYFNSQTRFYEARLGLAQAAADLFGADSKQVKAVNEAFDQVGVVAPRVASDFSGFFVSSPHASAHPYANHEVVRVTYTQPGATKMKVKFAHFHTETYFDPVYIQDKNGRTVATYSGNLGNFESVAVAGDTLTVAFQADEIISFYGFDIEGYTYQDAVHVTGVKAVGSIDSIQLSWQNPTINEQFDHSEVYRSQVGSASKTLIYSGKAEDYSDASVSQNVLYRYSISSVFKDQSVHTLEANTVTASLKVLPTVPTFFTGIPGLKKAALSWASREADPLFSEFLVVRNTQPTLNGSLVYGGDIVYRGTGTSVVDTALINNQTYYYFLLTRNKSGYWSAPTMLALKTSRVEVDKIKLNQTVLGAQSTYTTAKPDVQFYFNYPETCALRVTLNAVIREVQSGRVFSTFTLAGTSPESLIYKMSASSTALVPHKTYVLSYTLSDDSGYSESFPSIYTFDSAETQLDVHDFLTGPNPFNPFSQPVVIQYVLSKPADVSLYVYSISGQKIWSTTVYKNGEGGQEGLNKLSWDGVKIDGNKLENGLYILYLIASDGTATINKKWKLGVLSR